MIQQWTSRRGLRLLPYQVHDFTVTEESGLATIVSRDMKKKRVTGNLLVERTAFPVMTLWEMMYLGRDCRRTPFTYGQR